MKRIVADSSCDIRTLESGIYRQVPLVITAGDKNYTDNEELNVSQMMQELKSYKGKTCTACPGPEDYKEAFGDSDEVFVVTITSELSGSNNSAEVAKKIALEEKPDRKIFILDSLSTGPEMSLIVFKLEELIQSGKEYEEIVKEITKYHEKTKLCFLLSSMDNLVKNGRVPQALGLALNILNISLVGRASEKGKLQPIGKCRGLKKGILAMIKEMKEQGYQGKNVIIAHNDNEEGAVSLKDKIIEEYGDAKVSIMKAGGLCSFYAEIGGLLVGYEI